MRAVIQRVLSSAVSVEGECVGNTDRGLLVFLGVGQKDSKVDADWLCEKILKIRCFEDENGKMNNSLTEIRGDMMIISQFTLYGNLKKGTRPSFNRSATPEVAIPLYEYFIEQCREKIAGTVSTGVFGADMKIIALNDGPVTLILDTENKEF